MSFLRIMFLVIMAATVSGCSGTSIWASDEEVEKRSYSTSEPPYLILKTMINNKTGAGGHTSLVVNSGEVVMYDPAGRWSHSWVPERNDVLFGLIPTLMQQYDSFHARDTHHVVSQKIYVSPEVAALAKQLIFAKGASPDGFCASYVSSMLRQLPGFGGVTQTFFPAKLMRSFATLPGVVETKYYETDTGQN